MNQIRDVVNLDTKAFIMFSDLIKQFYEVKSDTLKVLNLKLSHLKILHLLSDHNGINQQEIAVISASKRSTISEIISEMESEDLVMRIGNDKDRRVMNIFLTERGKTASDLIQSEFRKYCMQCMDSFSDAEVLLFQQLLNRFQISKRKKINAANRSSLEVFLFWKTSFFSVGKNEDQDQKRKITKMRLVRHRGCLLVS